MYEASRKKFTIRDLTFTKILTKCLNVWVLRGGWKKGEKNLTISVCFVRTQPSIDVKPACLKRSIGCQP